MDYKDTALIAKKAMAFDLMNTLDEISKDTLTTAEVKEIICNYINKLDK